MEASKNRQRFVGLAEKRVTRAIKHLRLIGNLSNKSNYSYTDQDVKKIIGALESEIRGLKRRFETERGAEEVVFKLE